MALALRAYAKLNLALEVLARRPDGYHEIATVLQTISLADDLTFRPAADLGLWCSEPSLETPENLVLQAAHLLQDATGCRKGAAIRLEKGIPPASGLGGGSSDAAATLWALNRLWELSLDAEALHPLAARLGSDVPFFLRGGTALARGRGEEVRPLPLLAERWFLVVRPHLDIPRKTATLYGRLREQHWTRGRATEQLVAALESGAPLREAYIFNTFDAVAAEAFPGIGAWRRRLLECAPSRPHLAGAGPSLFIPVEDEAHGQAVVQRLRSYPGASVFIVKTVPQAHEVLEEDSS